MPSGSADLVAAFNRIPVGTTPFVVSFESHLPRLFTYEKSAAFRWFTERLCDERCRGIVPISRFAQRMFLRQHDGGPYRERLMERLAPVVYPSVDVPSAVPERETGERLRVFFVGSHFARKGGLSLLLAAERAHAAGLPIDVHIVSDLTVGGENGVWTDPQDAAFFDDYRALLDLPNVTLHGKMVNKDVIAMLRQSDVSVLPTLCDTFGYSVLESFAAGVPTIATSVSALPEIITDAVNGYLLDLETNSSDEWVHLFSCDRAGAHYRKVFTETVHDVSDKLYTALERLVNDPVKLASMKKDAHVTARRRFSAQSQSAILDNLYEAAVTSGASLDRKLATIRGGMADAWVPAGAPA